jgi:cytochrome bd-type quinol oxidase subunit 2
MTTKFKLTLASIFAAMGLMIVAAIPAVVNAQVNENLCRGVLLEPGATCDDITDTAETEVNELATTIIDIFSLVVGIVSVIVIIVAGFRYIISGGEATNIQGARNTILYAVVGLVIVIFAQTIVKFVVNQINN